MYSERYERLCAVVFGMEDGSWMALAAQGGREGLSFKRCSAPLANLHNGRQIKRSIALKVKCCQGLTV